MRKLPCLPFSPVQPRQQQMAAQRGILFPGNHLDFRIELDLLQLFNADHIFRKMYALVNIKPETIGLISQHVTSLQHIQT
ncbi:hypothetical protein D3C74_231970 [compost metagenome]